MKRVMGLLMCAAVLLSACGTAVQTAEEGGYDLYFLAGSFENAAGGGALATEHIRILEKPADTQALAELLVTKLLEGPAAEELESAVPAGTSLLGVELQGRRAVVDLSSGYGSLSGIALTLADYAITLTLTQLPDILAVEITVRGQELIYRDQKVFTAHDVLLLPEEDVVGTVTAVLYFLDEWGNLVPQRRELDLYEGDTQAGAVVAALADGPESKDLFAVFPEGFYVRSAWQEEDVCYVNLSTALLEELPEIDPAILQKALEAVGKSLCSLENVSETCFLVDGEYAQEYGSVSVAEPYVN